MYDWTNTVLQNYGRNNPLDVSRAGPYPQGFMGTSDIRDPDALTSEVQRDELIENRLHGLMSLDHPLMRQAAAQATARNIGRGGLHGAHAAGHALDGQRQFALPIAQADADKFFQSRIKNQDDLNAIKKANIAKDASIQSSAIGAGAGVRSAEIREAGARERQMAGQDWDTMNNALNRGHQRLMAGDQFGYQSALMDQGYGHDLGRLGAQTDENMRYNQWAIPFANNEQMRYDNFRLPMEHGFNMEQLNASGRWGAYGQYLNGMGNAWSSIMNGMGAMYQNPNLSPEQQQAGANWFMGSFENFQPWWDDISSNPPQFPGW